MKFRNWSKLRKGYASLHSWAAPSACWTSTAGKSFRGPCRHSRKSGSLSTCLRGDNRDSPTLQENAVLVFDEQGSVELRMKGVPTLVPTPGAFSRDGSRLAVCWTSAKGWTVTFYRLQDGDRSMVRVNPECFTSSVAFSPDNSCVVTAGEDGVTRVWDSATGAKRAECRGHCSKVLRVAFRPDGRRFLTTSADGSVRQWDPATGREVEAAYERQTGEIMSAAYSPDGQWIASGGTDRTVRLWRRTIGKSGPCFTVTRPS